MERRLESSRAVRAALERVREVLIHDPEHLLTGERRTTKAEPHQHPVTLAADLGDGAGVRHEVLVRLGSPTIGTDEVRWSLHWEPTAHRRALPVFDGELIATRTAAGAELALVGGYRPPLGLAGVIGDSVLGHRVARSCADNLLLQIAERVERSVAHDLEVGGIRPADYPPDLRS